MSYLPALIRESGLPRRLKYLLFVYHSRLGENELYFASVQTALRDSGLSKDSYYRHRKELEDLGVINVDNRGTRTASVVTINETTLNDLCKDDPEADITDPLESTTTNTEGLQANPGHYAWH